MAKQSFLRKCLPLTVLLVATIVGTVPAIAQSEPTTINNTQINSSPAPATQMDVLGLPIWVFLIGTTGFILLFVPKMGWIGGLIAIGELEVGIVTKKFSSKSLPAGRLIALNGEAGLQADTLPPGWHFGYFPWQYSVHKAAVVSISQDEIGLIVAKDGAAIPPQRILGKVVESENFQNARSFFNNGGEKGRQLMVITTGTYRINTALFEVITSQNAAAHDMTPAHLKVCTVQRARSRGDCHNSRRRSY